MMNRRLFLQDSFRLAAALGSATAAWPALAAPTEGEAFDRSAAGTPWLAPFKGVTDATGERRCERLALRGRWPAELRGRFYRNGPALFERAGRRYHHWFAGDGMVQQFSLDGGPRPAVRHLGGLVRTAKLQAEQQAGQFVYPAYGTRIESDEPAQGPDSFNTANTSAVEHAGRLLAMWEGGSAYALRPGDLETIGPVTWQAGLEQMPFSAHPKIDAAGNLWNVGAAGDRIVVWQIDPTGALVRAQVGESPFPGGMAHDAAVTPRWIVLPLPPVKLRFGEDAAGGAAFECPPGEPLRILVMRKDDIRQRRVFELPGQMVFHVGNAHELADGRIALSYVGSATPDFAIHGASELVAGRPARPSGSCTRLARLDPATGWATVESLDDRVEFPRIHPGLVGLPARHLLSAASWRDLPFSNSLFHGLQLRDMETGRVQRLDYGDRTVVEEHIVVPKPGRRGELDAWVLGTTYDTARRVTRLNLLDARHLGDGPIAEATLPYGLPYGFHGNFTPT